MKKNYYIVIIVILLMSIVAGGIYYILNGSDNRNSKLTTDSQTKTQNQEPFTIKPNIDFKSLSQKDE